MPTGRIVLVEDDANIRFGLRNFLESHGYEVEETEHCQGAEQAFQAARPDLALLDYRLPDGTALDLLPRLKAIEPEVPLVLLTAHGSIDLAVQTIKAGAEHFLTKPVDLPALLVVLQRLLEHQRNRQKHLARQAQQRREEIDPFLGQSLAIQQLATQAARVLATDRPVLIRGATGTGKGVLARWLHRHGPRADEAWVDLNCAGLLRELLETELFGHDKGAFTGAVSSKTGLLEVAHHGTLFLDEIGDVDPQVQPKLLKVLEDKRYRRLGEVRERVVDVRLIAATHQDLSQLMQTHAFRSDLYFRISTISLTIPSLQQRSEDIPALTQALLERLSAEMGRGAIGVSPEAARLLQTYPWPGNIRELRNVLERALLLSDSATLRPADLHFDMATSEASWADEAHLTLRQLEQRHIIRVLKAVRGQVSVAAQQLGVPRSSLYQKLKHYGIEVSTIC